MARPLHIEMANGLYHRTFRGCERREFVSCDQDREDWLRLLDGVAVRCQWRVVAWTLMSTHFHLFLRTHQPRRRGNDARVAAVWLLRRLTGTAVLDLTQQFGSVSVVAISQLLGRAELRRQEGTDWDQSLREL